MNQPDQLYQDIDHLQLMLLLEKESLLGLRPLILDSDLFVQLNCVILQLGQQLRCQDRTILAALQLGAYLIPKLGPLDFEKLAPCLLFSMAKGKYLEQLAAGTLDCHSCHQDILQLEEYILSQIDWSLFYFGLAEFYEFLVLPFTCRRCVKQDQLFQVVCAAWMSTKVTSSPSVLVLGSLIYHERRTENQVQEELLRNSLGKLAINWEAADQFAKCINLRLDQLSFEMVSQ